MKIVINDCYGGFSLSHKAQTRYAELNGAELKGYGGRQTERDDPILIKVIEELGEDADGEYAALKIVEIPEGVRWQIEEYDGMEWVAEQHRTWR